MQLGFWTYKKLLSTIKREKKHMLAEIVKVKGLMPLLMKPRNGESWTAEDKTELMGHLKRLSGLSPYFAAVFLPGGFLMLPVLAWWLDRRRVRRIGAAAAADAPSKA
jgi:hypothetical protein